MRRSIFIFFGGRRFAPWRKPLVVFTPKSMLRHPDASSPIADFTRGKFLSVVPDTEAKSARRI